MILDLMLRSGYSNCCHEINMEHGEDERIEGGGHVGDGT